MRASQYFNGIFKNNRPVRSIKFFIAVLTFLGIAVFSAGAQHKVASPYQGEGDGVSVGGNWVEFRSEDKMTGRQKSPL